MKTATTVENEEQIRRYIDSEKREKRRRRRRSALFKNANEEISDATLGDET